MKLCTAILCLVVISAHQVLGQVDSALYRSFSVGVSASELGDDPGIGIEIGSPSIFRDRILFRINGSLMWLEEYKAANDHWARYKAFNACVAYNFKIIERARPFLSLGTLLILSANEATNTRKVHGYSCSLGIELFPSGKSRTPLCYYFSVGVSHVKAYADKLDTKPRYADGLFFNNGLRFYL